MEVDFLKELGRKVKIILHVNMKPNSYHLLSTYYVQGTIQLLYIDSYSILMPTLQGGFVNLY